jgi:short-subunit dehydrogenase
MRNTDARDGEAAPGRQRDRWALVTGASSGIGAEFAHALASRGWNLVLTARREERLRELAEALSFQHAVRTAVVGADLSVPGEAQRVWAEAAEGRAIHLLVNNAGFGLQGRFDELPLERQMEMVRLNCLTVAELAHLALREMRGRGEGGIINVASTAAFQPVPLMATYAATKAFVLSLSQALWDENRAAGIRVLALCPGTIPTEFQRVAGTSRGSHSPGALAVSQVVRSALDALDKGGSYRVPGTTNRLASTLSRLLPLPLTTRIAGIMMQRNQ